jgi:hypothetical protein
MEGDNIMQLHLDFMLFEKHKKKKDGDKKMDKHHHHDDCKCKHKHDHKCDNKCAEGIKEELKRLRGRLVKVVVDGGYFIGIVGNVDCDKLILGPAPFYYPVTISLCEMNGVVELPYYPYFNGTEELSVADQLALNFAGAPEVEE